MSENYYAPIALFAYKRKEHLSRLIDSLLKNKECENSLLYIFCDGSRREDENRAVKEVREFASGVEGFKKVEIIEREKNLGLSKSLTSGVTEICNKYGKVIVLEDDLVLSPYFLQFMNEGLQVYKNEETVASIHGHVYPVDENLPENFFIRGADCWGWGTWKRAWDHYESDGKKLLRELKKKKLAYFFDVYGNGSYIKMLKDQIKGKNDSWAVRWKASAFLPGMVTLYPGESLVVNRGHDGSGEHCGESGEFEVELSKRAIKIEKVSKIEHSKDVYQIFAKFYRLQKIPFLKRVINKARRVSGLPLGL